MSGFARRQFLKTAGFGLAGLPMLNLKSCRPDEQAMADAGARTESFVKLREEQERRKHELPEPADFHRLPLEWHKNKTRQIKQQARERGIDTGILLINNLNHIYMTGLHYSDTQRPFMCFLPMDDDEACIWFYPYLDQTLIEDWWSTGQYYYFDFHHAEGGFPQHGEVYQGDTVNLWRWVGGHLHDLGYGSGRIGTDAGIGLIETRGRLPGQEDAAELDLFGDYDLPEPFRPESGTLGMLASQIPEAEFMDISDMLIRHRCVKDEQENRLTQLAEDYWSEIHAFARNYILERGTGITDWEVAHAAQMWGMERIMQDIAQRGELHNAVGISVGVSCRSGPVTAFPHPNQATWHPVNRGDAMQFAGVVRIGGYGGEQYRSFLIHPWTEWQEHVWDVHTESYFIQAEESWAGNTCSNVAKAVHDHQVNNDCAHLIYHRPGHGAGMEGHQPPFQALGDYTVMRQGMHFSNEPGLYDPENGFGFNHSNNILVSEDKGHQMGTAPIDKEWCFLRL